MIMCKKLKELILNDFHMSKAIERHVICVQEYAFDDNFRLKVGEVYTIHSGFKQYHDIQHVVYIKELKKYWYVDYFDMLPPEFFYIGI